MNPSRSVKAGRGPGAEPPPTRLVLRFLEKHSRIPVILQSRVADEIVDTLLRAQLVELRDMAVVLFSVAPGKAVQFARMIDEEHDRRGRL